MLSVKEKHNITLQNDVMDKVMFDLIGFIVLSWNFIQFAQSHSKYEYVNYRGY